jgi:hypothetical protein
MNHQQKEEILQQSEHKVAMCKCGMLLAVSELMRCEASQQECVPSLGMDMLCHQEVVIDLFFTTTNHLNQAGTQTRNKLVKLKANYQRYHAKSANMG